MSLFYFQVPRYSFTGRTMLFYCGLDMVMLNVFHKDTVSIARACDVLLKGRIFAWEEIP